MATEELIQKYEKQIKDLLEINQRLNNQLVAQKIINRELEIKLETYREIQ